MNGKQLTLIKEYVNQLFRDDATGHDFYHMKRVAALAKQIAEAEEADLNLCVAAAWLHDVGDDKLFSHPTKAVADMNKFLQTIGMTEKQISVLNTIIHGVSFRKGQAEPESLEGKIVQDADRLDAIGAIGIARTFAYGGANHQLIHHPEQNNTSIQHFYDKLFKLKTLMHTSTAKKIAVERHQFMENFLNQFFEEWDQSD